MFGHLFKCFYSGLMLQLLFLPVVTGTNDESVVQEIVLKNGLKVITCEVHNIPAIFSQISYKVGSRNESYGQTGISHLVEHMMFKGTPKYPKGVISQTIKNAGGLFNAFTDKDMTAYFTQIPKNNIEVVFDIESERMMNCVFDEVEFKLEREVVKEERRMRTDDSSIGLFREEMLATAFHAHPLRHPTIGWMDDLNFITRDQAFEYYKTYYTPNNATLVLVGDFETAAILKRVNHFFGRIPRGPKVPRVADFFEQQRTRREFTLRRPDERMATLEFGFHVPGMGHPDEPALQVAASIFNTSSFASFGKIISTEKKWGQSSSVRYSRGKDPELFRFSVKLFEKYLSKIDSVEAIVFQCIQKIQQDSIPEREFQKIQNRNAYQEIFENQKLSQIGSRLSRYETYSSWKDADKYNQALKKVTPEDVQRVMQIYFSPDKVTIGKMLPRDYLPHEKLIISQNKNIDIFVDELDSSEFSYQSEADVFIASLPPNPIAQRIQTARLENGIEIYGIEDHTLPVLFFSGVIHTGQIAEEINFCNISSLLGSAMNQGTTKRSVEMIYELKSHYPLAFEMNGSNGALAFGGDCLVENADTLIQLSQEILRYPAFNESSLDQISKKSQAILKASEAKAGWNTSSFVFETIYPNHPYGNLPAYGKFTLNQVTSAQLHQMHKKYVRPERLKIVIFGDFEFSEMVTRISRYFGDWHNPTEFQYQPFPDVPWYSGRTVKVFPMPEKTQVEIRIGASWVGWNDPRNTALEILNFILGGSSLTSRLGLVIRDNLGLAYQINSKLRQRANAGICLIISQTSPATAKELIRSVFELIQEIREAGISQRELDDAKNYFLQTLVMRNESPEDLYRTFADLIRENRPLNDFDTQYDRIRNVTLEEVNRLAREILNEKNYVIVAAGSIPEDFLDELK